jgi:hypothetical protein
LIRLAPNAAAMDFVGAGKFNFNVTPGNYAFLCFVEDPDTGAPHFALGMLEEFSIQQSEVVSLGVAQ